MTDEEPQEPTTLREDLELLHSIVCDIAKMTPKLKSITNQMLFEAMRKSLVDMTNEQNRLVSAIVARSSDQAARERFEKVRDRLTQLELEIQGATEMEEIKRLGEAIEGATDQYSQQFQDIVKGIVESEKAQQAQS